MHEARKSGAYILGCLYQQQQQTNEIMERQQLRFLFSRNSLVGPFYFGAFDSFHKTFMVHITNFRILQSLAVFPIHDFDGSLTSLINPWLSPYPPLIN